MKGRKGLITVVGYLSVAFLVWICLAYIFIPHNNNTTSNYCFSDKTELLDFESKLKEENIPFSRISETSIKISKNNTEQADQVFNQIFE